MLLYFHIPFCSSKCLYCSFNSFTNEEQHINYYFDALIKQFLYDINNYKILRNSVETVYIGGGTPSIVNVEHYYRLFDIISPYLKQNIEITIEANPNLNLDWLKEIKNLSNRISFGVQTFNQNKLNFLGRTHTVKESIRAIEYAFKIGFNNINIDFIYDTAIDTKKILENDIQTIKSLPINHISAYSLTIEKNSKFENKINKKTSNINIGIDFINQIKNLDFYQYEISNFAKDNYYSRHNNGYWKGKNYLGIGCGAVGFIDTFRYIPSKNIKNYIKKPTQYKIEQLTKKDLRFEKIFLGLRSNIGVDLSIFTSNELKKIDILLKENKLYKHNNRIFNPNFFLTDEIVLYIC